MQAKEACDGGKKAYSAPRLILYGQVEKLTGQQSLGPKEDKLVGIPTDGRPFAS